MSVSRLYSRLFTKVLFLHYILNQISSLAVCHQRGQQRSRLFIDHVNHVLDVPKIQKKQVTSMVHFLHGCLLNHRCFSTNIMVGRDKNGGLTCQLLPTDKFNASDFFRPRQFCHHFSLVVRNRLYFLSHFVLKFKSIIALGTVPLGNSWATLYESVFEQRLINY